MKLHYLQGMHLLLNLLNSKYLASINLNLINLNDLKFLKVLMFLLLLGLISLKYLINLSDLKYRINLIYHLNLKYHLGLNGLKQLLNSNMLYMLGLHLIK